MEQIYDNKNSMKKLLTYILIAFFSFLFTNFTLANFDSDKVSFLIKYVDDKISDLEKIGKKYDIENDDKFISRVRKLEEIKKILVRTKRTWEYNKYIAKITEQLKENNNLIKTELKEKINIQKNEALKYSDLYYDKVRVKIKKIDKIIIDIARKLMEKEKLSDKDKQIVWLLSLAKQKLDDIKDIKKRNWNSKNEVKQYIISSFNQIAYNFKQIRSIVMSR